MKKIIILMTIAVTAAAINAFAYSPEPGSFEDPVVTKSYVDKMIAQGGSAEINDFQLEFIIGEVSEAIKNKPETATPPADTASAIMFTPVNVPAGNIIIGGEGTEIILRSGTAQGYTEGAEGVVNATTGEEVVNGTEIQKNNLLIVPRSDGRGAFCITDCWFIVKGGYTLR